MQRTSAADLARVEVKGSGVQLVPLAELGRWDNTARVDQIICPQNLQRVAYVFAETAGRPPADVVVDVLADREAGLGTPARHQACGQWLDYHRRTLAPWNSGPFFPTAATSAGGYRTAAERRERVAEILRRLDRMYPGATCALHHRDPWQSWWPPSSRRNARTSASTR